MIKSLVLALGMMIGTTAFAEAEVGKDAPQFIVKDANGVEQKLSDYKGKWVVLEWLNKGCPYVKRHYESKNMQNLQQKAAGQKVVWLSVISSAPGKQGHVSGTEALADAKARGATPAAILIDENGKVGKAYGAKTTPHMFIIDPSQKLAYMGGIDSDSSPKGTEDPSKVKHYVADALDSIKNDKPLAVTTTKPYGCSVKYD